MISAVYYDKGDFAPKNQDALVLEEVCLGRKKAALMAVCDGIGGLERGEYASSYVTMRLRSWFYESALKEMERKGTGRRIKAAAMGVLYDCNRHLVSYGKQYGVKLGTTVTMTIVLRHRYYLFHAGDSRAVLVGRRCRWLSRDDVYQGNTLSRCIGSYRWQGVSFRRGSIRKGETLLLCTDGFWRKAGEEELCRSLGGGELFGEGRLEKRLEKLGQETRKRGEKDNQAAVALCMTKKRDW